MSKVEWIDRHCGRKHKRWLKRQLAKARRRAERRFQADAPVHRRAYLWGWS